jgi:hypothetical protein
LGKRVVGHIEAYATLRERCPRDPSYRIGAIHRLEGKMHSGSSTSHIYECRYRTSS